MLEEKEVLSLEVVRKKISSVSSFRDEYLAIISSALIVANDSN